MQTLLRKAVFRLENYKISFLRWLAAFFCVIYLRIFTEIILDYRGTIGLIPDFERSLRHIIVYWNIQWAAMFLILVLVFHLFSKENITKISRITLVFYLWLVVPIIINFFVYHPNSQAVSYIYTAEGYLNALKYFFIPNVDIGVSIGVRLEVMGAVLLSFLYLFIKTSGVVKSFFASLVIYFLAVSSMAYPVFITFPVSVFSKSGTNEFINNFFSAEALPPHRSDKFSILTIFLIIVCAFLLFFFYNKNSFLKFFKTLFKSTEILVFPALFLAGVFYASTIPDPYDPFLKYNIFSRPFDIFFTGACALLSVLIYINMIFFKAKKRHITLYRVLFPLNLMLLLVLSFVISYPVFLISLFILVLSFILYKEPFKLKRFYLPSGLISALIYTLLLFSGFTAVMGIYSPESVDRIIFIFLYILFFIAIISVRAGANAPSRKKPGRFSIDKKYKKIILSELLFAAYLVLPVILKSAVLFFASTAAGIISIMAINLEPLRKREKNILFLCLVLFLIFFAAVIIRQ